MAFIRKHRLVLVPLFVVAIAGLGLFFLLRSQSEEPGGNVWSARPRETVQAWQEDVAKRTQHGREYAFLRTVEYVDPETEEVVTDEVVSTVRERGTNVCYKDDGGDWRPTVAEWETGGLGFKMKENSWQIEVPLTLSAAYQYAVGGRTLAMRPSVIGLSDGQQTVVLGRIDTSVVGEIDEDDPSRLVFADVLGANSGVDIELVLERAALHQNVVLRAKPALPEGFNAESTRLYVYTELGLDALTAGGDVNVRVGGEAVNVSATDLATARTTNEPITFTVETTIDGKRVEAPLHRFVASRVWDETGPENETVAARQLWRHPFTSTTYLVESLPYSYIADATGAVTLDYESQNGTIDADETWTADATYYVTGNVVIGQDVTLTIEPGTVVKFAEDTQINAGIYETESGAKIVAKGEPYNYIVFTSDTDDNCGEDLTPGESTSGTSSYYTLALEVGRYGDVTSEIEYCKAAFGLWGFVTSRRLNTPVAHCIVDDCWCGILMCRGDSDSASDVFNCLVRDCALGICAWIRGTRPAGFNIVNNTIDGCGYGFRIEIEDGSGSAPAFNLKSNLLTGCTVAGIGRTGSGTGATPFVDSNGFWDNEDDYVGNISGTNDVTLNGNPYETTDTQLGSFFIDTSGDGGELVDAGNGNADDANLYGDGTAGSNTLFVITAPEVVDSDITSDATWDKRTVDTGTVDIGYHHPRVDKVIDNTAIDIGTSSAVELEIDPGVVVAFCGSSATLGFNGSATADPTLTCDGDPDDYIVMAGAPSVSMDIEAKRDGSSSGAIQRGVVSSADETASVTYSRFIGLHVALRATESSTGEIMHCVFERNGKGLQCQYLNYAQLTCTLKNCLFQNNDTGCELGYGMGGSKSATLRSCTFDRANTGVSCMAYSTSGRSLTIKDCLFTNCSTAGVYLGEVPGAYDEDYNAYSNCESNVYDFSGGSGSGPYGIGTNSIVLLANPYDTSWTDWGDRWYLDQDGACIDGGSDVVQDSDIDLDTFTTDLDGKLDVATVDIGYHYAGPAGVEDVDLEDDSTGTDLIDVVLTDTQDIELNIDVDNSGDDDWTLYVGETPVDTGSGDFSDYTLDLSEVTDGDGTYVIRIVYDDPNIDDIVFTILIDETPPGVTIQWPEDTATVGGI